MRSDLSRLLTDQHKRILWNLRIQGAAPRAEIAQQLGIHAGPMTRLTRELITLDLIEEREQVLAERGRPSIPLAVAGGGGYAAGATVHPGWLEIVLVDFAGTLIAREAQPFASPDPRVFAEAIDARLRAMAGERSLMRTRFLGLGLAVPGPVTKWSPRRRRTVEWLRGWQDVDLPDYFEDYLGVPVFVENEATCAGLAEFYDSGLIRSCDSAIVFFLGHGVGAGVISRRNVFGGEHGNAGEIGGFFPLDRARPSAIDLLKTLREAGAAIETLNEIDQVLESHAETIAAWAVRAGDQLWLAVDAGIGWIDPGAIVLSGGLPPSILQALGDRVTRGKDMIEHPSQPSVRFHVSRLGSWAAAIGAALIPIHEITASVHGSPV
ncbi:ROK family protein [Sphingomonas sp. KR3-1]|uniref:ROK family protein n=1 Tax=Sphingomonas sp. KR3-1 TaxID=3156611 RepID=UPI0032B5FDE4